MKIDITSLCFGFKIEKDNDSGTPAWATSIGQAPKNICFIDTNRDGIKEFVFGMMYKSHSDFQKLKDRNIPGISKNEEPKGNRERMMFSVFDNVYVNNKRVNGKFTLSYEREDTKSHKNRLHICYAKYLTYDGHSNKTTLEEMANVLGCNKEACWFVYDISIKNQTDLHFAAIVVNPSHNMVYSDSKERKREWEKLVPVTIINSSDMNTHQIIYYGAPGTGKSNTIKREVEDKRKRHHRTTFHPDSDYSTFVGAYKPSMDRSIQIYTSGELIIKLSEIKDSGVSYPCQKFATKYWESLKDLSAEETKRIITSCGFTESMTTEVSKGIAIGQELYNKSKEGKIIYSFTPQAFSKAYVEAWSTEEEVYLIIEEINRGNCAQIFGDLFQLLDRKNGVSEYPIDADSDLKDYLCTALQDSLRTDFPTGVKEGKKLVLPSNLYIWATMNTSDQSLFPIDSAFKRRWEWKYIPIKDHPEKNYRIKIGETEYDWWGFLSKINQVINTTTSSEDKKLGYFFAKAEDGVINDEQFVGKVLFYLWNDVFKNYGFDNPIFDKADKEKFAFSDFFNVDGSPNHDNVNLFLKNLGLEAKEDASNEGKGSIAVIYNGERVQMSSGKDTFVEIVKKAINDKGVQQVADVIGNDLTQTKQGETRRYIDIAPGWFLATNIGIDKIKTNLNKLKEGLSLDIDIEDIPVETIA